MSQAQVSAAPECAYQGCTQPRTLPRPKRSNPAEMTHGSKYCKAHARDARKAWSAMIGEQNAERELRYAAFASAWSQIDVAMQAASTEAGGSVRITPANASVSYWLVKQGYAARVQGQKGVVISVKQGARALAGMLDKALATLDKRASVTYSVTP